MDENILDMHLLANNLSVHAKFWDRAEGKFRTGLFTFDTGASVTTVSKDILFNLGYDVETGNIEPITTASGLEYVREVFIDKIRFGGFEFENVLVYAHTFPEESLSTGVIGLNILSRFDINMLFSKRQIVLTEIPDCDMG
ncbi:MAG: retroviral-like aspartic protease family protein [Defluviitaleaceae bacterium]|nr:retroviral-like aspartic protease family protein [Defluviitaleaceae bacterium]